MVQSHKQAKNRVRKKSREILFDGFPAEEHLVGERRFHRKMGPLARDPGISLVPCATVKRRDIFFLRSCFLLRLEPDTDAARRPVTHERLQGFLQQLFTRSAVQGGARHASPAWSIVRVFPPHSHRWLSPPAALLSLTGKSPGDETED